MKFQLMSHPFEVGWKHIIILFCTSMIPIIIIAAMLLFGGPGYRNSTDSLLLLLSPITFPLLAFLLCRLFGYDFKESDLVVLGLIPSALFLASVLLFSLLMLSPQYASPISTSALLAILFSIPVSFFTTFLLLYLAFNFDLRKVAGFIVPSLAIFITASVLKSAISYFFYPSFPSLESFAATSISSGAFMPLYIFAALFYVRERNPRLLPQALAIVLLVQLPRFFIDGRAGLGFYPDALPSLVYFAVICASIYLLRSEKSQHDFLNKVDKARN